MMRSLATVFLALSAMLAAPPPRRSSSRDEFRAWWDTDAARLAERGSSGWGRSTPSSWRAAS